MSTHAWRHCAIIIFTLGLTLASLSAQVPPASTQVIDLKPGWNLISVQVGSAAIPVASFKAMMDNPATTTVDESARLIEIWGYTPSANPSVPGSWQTYQPQVSAFASDLATMQPGRGYWINVSQFTQATLTGPRWDGSVTLQAGWNLVGFPGLDLTTDEAQEITSVFGSQLSRVPQVWTFDTSLQRFSGYDITAVPQLKELNLIKPGHGYWVYALEPVVVTPQPYVALPGDADASPLEDEVPFVAPDFPLLTNPDIYVGTQIRKVRNSSEDVPFDLNGNKIIDSAFTQDTLMFDVGVDRKVITVGNNGTGIANWVLANSVPWLFTAASDAKAYPNNAGRPKNASGVVSADRDAITLYADTTGLLPGIQTGTITLYLGSLTRTITVKLDVPVSSGDWKGYATTQRVNGRNVGIGAVDMGINLFMEEGSSTRFRAVLNKDTSLLFPRDVFMNGVFYSGNDFSLTTNFEMSAADRNAPPFDTFPAKRATGVAQPPLPTDPTTLARTDSDVDGDGKMDSDNPFPFPIHREITLLGTRTTPSRMDGSYIESITGMLPNNQPIFIEGKFYLDRQTFEPTKRSIVNQTTTNSPIIIGSTTGQLYREISINVTSAVSIQGITLSLNVSFPDPTQLTITLFGPNGQSIIIHQGGSTLPTTLDLSQFNGLLGNGTWKVRVAWTPTAERGFFTSWGLNIQGLATYSITGKIAGNLGAGNVPLQGAHVVLSGGNLIEQADTDAAGQFTIPNLTENNYTLSISRPGFETRLISFFLNNASLYIGEGGSSTSSTMLNTPVILSPVSVPSPELRAGPFIGQESLFVSFTALIPIADLNALGTIATATWNFGDGTPPVNDTASTTDDIAQTTAKHSFTTAGDFTTTLTLTGSLTNLTLTTPIHVQRITPDASMPLANTTTGTMPAGHAIVAGFIGAFAAPLSDAGNPVQLAPGSGTTSQSIKVRQSNGSYTITTLTGVARATVPQESKRDSGGFDIDRPPFIALPGASDFHLNSGDLEDSDFSGQYYITGDGSVTLPYVFRTFAQLELSEQQTFLDDNTHGTFATNTPREVNGQPIPDRYRIFTTLGGCVFGTAPSKVGDFVLQAGRVEP